MTKPLYIFDLDGTLAITDHRQHYLEGPKKNWERFFEECDEDAPNEPVIQLMKQLLPIAEVWIFSGRSSLVMEKTIKWLEQHIGVPREGLPLLKMRRDGDFTPDDVLKRGWYHGTSAQERERLVCVFDDRNKVVEMWRSLGVTCLQVAQGDF